MAATAGNVKGENESNVGTVTSEAVTFGQRQAIQVPIVGYERGRLVVKGDSLAKACLTNGVGFLVAKHCHRPWQHVAHDSQAVWQPADMNHTKHCTNCQILAV
jgi:hypothetical protein